MKFAQVMTFENLRQDHAIKDRAKLPGYEPDQPERGGGGGGGERDPSVWSTASMNLLHQRQGHLGQGKGHVGQGQDEIAKELGVLHDKLRLCETLYMDTKRENALMLQVSLV